MESLSKLHLQQQLNLLKRKEPLFKCELQSQISLLSHSVVYIRLFKDNKIINKIRIEAKVWHEQVVNPTDLY